MPGQLGGDRVTVQNLEVVRVDTDRRFDVRAVQLALQISNTSVYQLIHQGEIPAMKLSTKTIRAIVVFELP